MEKNEFLTKLNSQKDTLSSDPTLPHEKPHSLRRTNSGTKTNLMSLGSGNNINNSESNQRDSMQFDLSAEDDDQEDEEDDEDSVDIFFSHECRGCYLKSIKIEKLQREIGHPRSKDPGLRLIDPTQLRAVTQQLDYWVYHCKLDQPNGGVPPVHLIAEKLSLEPLAERLMLGLAEQEVPPSSERLGGENDPKENLLARLREKRVSVTPRNA